MDVQEGTRERGRAVGGAGTSGGGAAERQGGADVTFGRSKLSGDVRDMLWVPPEAEDHGVGPNDDPDEGWSVDPTSGLVDPYAFPPTHTAECDDRAAARALRGLARASLRRIRAGVLRVRQDGAAHATLLTRLAKETRADGGEDGGTSSSYHTLALSLSIVERRCVDLYVSAGGTSRGTSPMLSEVLRSTEFSDALSVGDVGGEKHRGSEKHREGEKHTGALLWALRRALDPRCMNLRNVVWHGFLAPTDAQPELAALALVLAASIPAPRLRSASGVGTVSQPTGRTLARHDADLVQHMPGLVNDGWWRDPLAADEAAGIIAESEFVSDGWRDATALAAKDLIKRGDDARFVAIACPALEDALRTMFATVNDAPEALTARLGAYYATLDGFGQARVHDVILHPLRPSVDPNDPDARRPNAIPSKLPRGVRNALEDLFMRDKGPALRAAYAHGSVALDPDGRFEDVGHRADGVRGADGACARLLLLVILDMCVAVGALGGIGGDGSSQRGAGGVGIGPRRVNTVRPTLAGYHARFHPSVRFRASLEGAVRSMRPITGPSPRFTFTSSSDGDQGGPGGEALVLVFDSEAARENGTLPPRAGFTEKAGVLGKDTESQETTLREIVNAFLGVGDAPNSTAAALARSVLGDENAVAEPAHPPPPPGPVSGAEALRATADEVASASTAYVDWIERLLGAAERREARSNQRRQLVSLLKNQTNVALGLCALLLATERMEKIAGDCATDEVEIGSSTTRLLSHASSIRAACEAGQGADAARAAVGAWQTKAGIALLRKCVEA